MSEKRYNIDRYSKKRDTEKSGEPGVKGKGQKRQPLFSFQKHHASRMHYDFRLAYNGVLKSWSVPKGPSTDSNEKRLAIRTEDHPPDYIDFEGVIPEGNYGAGKVLLWDIGEYENITTKDGKAVDLNKAIESGHFKILLHGEKLRGGYAMTRIDEKKSHWLLIKTDDEEADARRNPISTEPGSVKSGKDIEHIN